MFSPLHWSVLICRNATVTESYNRAVAESVYDALDSDSQIPNLAPVVRPKTATGASLWATSVGASPFHSIQNG
jgi:hypothetical protein